MHKVRFILLCDSLGTMDDSTDIPSECPMKRIKLDTAVTGAEEMPPLPEEESMNSVPEEPQEESDDEGR